VEHPGTEPTHQRVLRLEAALRLLRERTHQLANDLTAARLLSDGVASEALVLALKGVAGIGELGRSLCEPESVFELDDCLRSLEAQLRAELSPDSELVMELAAPGENVELERPAFELLVHELVVNARRHAGAGVRMRISTSALEGGRVGIVLEDDGPGFPTAQLPELERPFYSTLPEGRGAGLGLSLARNLTQSSSGSLQLENRAAGGARIALAWSSAPPRPRPYTASGVVLVADAHGARRQLLADELRALSCDVRELANAAELEAELARDPGPRLLVLDAELPGLRGELDPRGAKLVWVDEAPPGHEGEPTRRVDDRAQTWSSLLD